jgi:sugar lactone lactonase YvrE
MKKHALIGFPWIIGVIILFTCSSLVFLQEIFIADNLSREWETHKDFKVPESVYYDNNRDVIYVANINGKSAAKDSNGFISRLSFDGNILDLHWIEGLDAPKGMDVYNNTLYVSDIDKVVAINILDEKIVKTFQTDSGKFLNDIVIDDSGRVFISDTRGNAVYMISGDEIIKWKYSPGLMYPNGLCIEGKNLLVGCKDKIVGIDLQTKGLKTLATGTGSIDGLETDGKGHYIISDWKGSIHRVSPDNGKELLLNTTPAKINAADIDFAAERKLLLVPTFHDNRIMAYTLE